MPCLWYAPEGCPRFCLGTGVWHGVKNYSKPHNVCIHSLVFGWMVSLGSRWLCKVKEDFLPYFGQGAEDKSKIFFVRLGIQPVKCPLVFGASHCNGIMCKKLVEDLWCTYSSSGFGEAYRGKLGKLQLWDAPAPCTGYLLQFNPLGHFPENLGYRLRGQMDIFDPPRECYGLVKDESHFSFGEFLRWKWNSF